MTSLSPRKITWNVLVCLLLYLIIRRKYISKLPSLQQSSVPYQDEHYGYLMDLTNFKFKIFNFVCDDSTKLFVFVNSAPSHFESRRAIRETWGKKRKGVSLAFILGDDPLLNEQLVEENEKFEDILQGNFLDCYGSISYKMVTGLKYAKNHCSWAQFVLKVDDDILVNMGRLLKRLEYFISEELILGIVVQNGKPIRHIKNKYFVGEFENLEIGLHVY